MDVAGELEIFTLVADTRSFSETGRLLRLAPSSVQSVHCPATACAWGGRGDGVPSYSAEKCGLSNCRNPPDYASTPD